MWKLVFWTLPDHPIDIQAGCSKLPLNPCEARNRAKTREKKMKILRGKRSVAGSHCWRVDLLASGAEHCLSSNLFPLRSTKSRTRRQVMALLRQRDAFAGCRWAHNALPGQQAALQIHAGILVRQNIEARTKCLLIWFVPLKYSRVIATNVYICESMLCLRQMWLQAYILCLRHRHNNFNPGERIYAAHGNRRFTGWRLRESSGIRQRRPHPKKAALGSIMCPFLLHL